MPTRTTRHKIKDKRRQVFTAIDRAVENLRGIHELGGGQSKALEDAVALSVRVLDETRKALEKILSVL